MTRSEQPLLSLVVACYSVEQYVPALIDSLERQLTDDVEVIVVDDGSTDATPAILREWAALTRHEVRLVEQENEGAAAARNVGIGLARGEWVSFPDADDVLGVGYIARVTRFLRSDEASGVDMAASRLLILDDRTGQVSDTHPLRGKFHGRRRRVVRLADEPDSIQMHANCAFVRRATLESHGIRFNPRIRPNFEDTDLLVRVLLTAEDPRLALLGDAQYLYRRRSDRSSLVASSWSKPEKYDDVLRYGYLPALEHARELTGSVPAWLQSVLLYDLGWYFKKDASNHSEALTITPTQSERFYELATRVLEGIDAERIGGWAVYPLGVEIRAVLLALKRCLPDPPTLRVDHRDSEQRLIRVRFFAPVGWSYAREVRYFVDEQAVLPAHGKVREVRFLGRTVLLEIVAWLPGTGSVAAEVGGVRMMAEMSTQHGTLSGLRHHRSATRSLYDAARVALGLLRPDRGESLRAALRAGLPLLAKGLSGSWANQLGRLIAPRYRDAWLLMDCDGQARDNAEHLYRYLMHERPDINAWFLLRRKSADWNRLKAEGFRLIPYGGMSHALAATQAREVASSEVGHEAVGPPSVFWLHPMSCRFTLLQHGVTHNGLARSVNRMPVSTVVAATPAEVTSFVDDGTQYVWTRREVVLTGLARHDALLAKAAATAEPDRRYIVFMPTWSAHLYDSEASGSSLVARDGSRKCQYARNWSGLLNSEAVRRAAHSVGYAMLLVSHPHMPPQFSQAVPAHVHIAGWDGRSVQDILAQASHVVTDDSFNAFEAACIERPVLFLQFDHDKSFEGGRTSPRVAFGSVPDRFGPVAETLESAINELVLMIGAGARPVEPYASRIRSTFTMRDGRACERIVAAIEEHRSPCEAWSPPVETVG